MTSFEEWWEKSGIPFPHQSSYVKDVVLVGWNAALEEAAKEAMPVDDVLAGIIRAMKEK